MLRATIITQERKTHFERMNKREIKFRIWDVLAKNMITTDNKVAARHIWISLDGSSHNMQNGAGGEEYILTQYTGQKDVDRVEIYEGDILEYDFVGKKFKSIVYWDGLGLFARDNQGYNLLARRFLYKKVEVVGNIFENPELLD